MAVRVAVSGVHGSGKGDIVFNLRSRLEDLVYAVAEIDVYSPIYGFDRANLNVDDYMMSLLDVSARITSEMDTLIQDVDVVIGNGCLIDDATYAVEIARNAHTRSTVSRLTEISEMAMDLYNRKSTWDIVSIAPSDIHGDLMETRLIEYHNSLDTDAIMLDRDNKKAVDTLLEAVVRAL